MKATSRFFVVAKRDKWERLQFLNHYEPNSRFLLFVEDLAQAEVFRDAGDAKKQIENCSGSEGCIVRKVSSKPYSIL